MSALLERPQLQVTPRPMALSPAISYAWAMARPSLIAAGLRPGASVVDLGCGDGAWTRLLASEVGGSGVVFGLDADPDCIAAAEASQAPHGSILFEAASAYDTGLPDDAVDIVFARHLFQHLGEPDRALREIYRLLRPGGTLCLLEPHDSMLWLHPEPAGHAAFVARAHELHRLRGGDRDVSRKLGGRVSAAGFSDVHTEVHVMDTGTLPPEVFAELALTPLAAPFQGDEAHVARAHLNLCLSALDAGPTHGTAGVVAVWATRF